MYFILLQTFVFTALISFFAVFHARAELPAQMTTLILQLEIPEKSAFLGWKEKQGWRTSNLNPFELPKTKVNCSDSRLYPTHPQQTTKEYHYFLAGQYDLKRVPGKSSVCRMSNKSSPQTPARCLMTERIELALLSDTYRDLCGKFYRGYWLKMFLQKEETMGTLLSHGRTVFENPESQFINDMLDGHTYAVNVEEFLFLTDLIEGDDKEISENQNRALLYTHDLDPQTLLFSPKTD